MGRPPTPIILYFPNQQACVLYLPQHTRPAEFINVSTYFPTTESVWKQYPNFRKQVVGKRTNVPYSILREACTLLGCESEHPWYFMPSNQWHPELRQYTSRPGREKPIVEFQWKAMKEGNPHYPTYS